MFTIEKQHTDTLELDKVLKMLADRAGLTDAKEKALALKPITELKKVSELLLQTDDAYRLCASYGSPSFGSARLNYPSLAKAESGGVLSMRELLDIADVLRLIRTLKDWKAHCENLDANHIEHLFEALIPNKYFEDKILSSIKNEEELNDNASPTLKNIRRKIHSLELNIRDRLDKIIHSANFSKFLQEAIITQRDGRFVIPVKAEYRGEISGLLHDTSSSGATLFIEPMAIVEINNDIRSLIVKEKEEIERILAELSGEAGTFAENIRNSYSAAVELCVIFAKASLAFDTKSSMPKLNDEGRIYLKNARHPLLDRKKVVPVTIPLGQEHDTLIITGPNTGGKTVTIKTIGLLTLMTMCGMMIPVSDGSEISVFNYVLADIGDEQSIEQSLSTFSAHMTKIVSILEKADNRSLVLIDELGAGTDPVEGAALATAILMKLRQQKAKIAATTHYAELKTFALETEGVCNASCEFDVSTLRPTYRLIVGMPGRSNAFAISQKLGLDTQVVDLAKSLVSQEDSRFERIVATLEKTVQDAENDRKEAAKIRGELEALKKTHKQLEEEINTKRKHEMDKAREKATAVVDRTRIEAEKLLSELEALRKSGDSAEERIRKARAEMKSGIKNMQDIADPVENAAQQTTLSRPLKKGDRVIIADINKQATVLADQSGDEVLVLAGIVKLTVPTSNLHLATDNKTAPAKHRTARNTAKPETTVRTAASEIDIRGFTAAEAELELDRFIDNSVMAGFSTVWVIHGKGTGALKKAVHAYLKTNRSVKEFRFGVYGEGEDGVTVVTLK